MKKIRKLVSFDWAIKRLLRSKANFDILEGFLSELLGDDIKILALLESESNKDYSGQKINRLDLKVANHKNEIVIIEIQYNHEYDYFFRMMFAASKATCEHISEGDAYFQAVKVISINILYFDLGHGSDYIYHGQTVFTGLHRHDELGLSSEQQKLFKQTTPGDIFPEFYLIKVNNFNGVARNTLDEWIYFLKNEEIKPGFKAKGLLQAKDRLDIMKLSDAERLAYSRYSDDLHYQASMVESSYGIGRINGIEEGIATGIEKVALNLLNMGQAIKDVSKATGLSAETLEKLRVSERSSVKETAAPYRVTKKRAAQKKNS
ncbi:MAG TPA: hypothetical protein DCG57_16970 [Candidatus Riflebacteria bacterium]|nr:hypothetical protein [Candidatus Riflebacteria bacterium]